MNAFEAMVHSYPPSILMTNIILIQRDKDGLNSKHLSTIQTFAKYRVQKVSDNDKLKSMPPIKIWASTYLNIYSISLSSRYIKYKSKFQREYTFN